MLEPWHAVLGPTSDDEDALRREPTPGLCLIAAVLVAMAHLAHAAPESIDPPPPIQTRA